MTKRHELLLVGIKMNKKTIITQYLLDKITTKLDEAQMWQENLADVVEKNEPVLEHQLTSDRCMRQLAHDLRVIMDLVEELDELINAKTKDESTKHDCSRDDCRCWEE